MKGNRNRKHHPVKQQRKNSPDRQPDQRDHEQTRMEGGGAKRAPPSAPQARGLFRRGQTGASSPARLTVPVSSEF
ncbi:hypothetical protein D6437_17640 [Salmonella enterica subsp. enterica serovar Java]|nr:hypothetical protein [Salmonella enterica]EBJ7549522.1 hypothetical protein [Salmonella enterica]EBL2328777.1 hypothetical protein [Salmonella enterica]EBZ0590446.1 hypothetical protein [Salmonella enterica subsp. enterica serovar Java]